MKRILSLKFPLIFLIHAQGFRESPLIIEDENAMAEYFKRYFLSFNRRQYEDVGSDFEIFLMTFSITLLKWEKFGYHQRKKWNKYG